MSPVWRPTLSTGLFVFGGMFFSGRKAAQLILEELG
jgi:ribulose 1,5-bisphosphate synthetase/thiazole synthase